MKNALIIQAARFGDLLQTKRLIKSVARSAQIHLVCEKSLAQLAALIYPEAIIYGLDFHGASEQSLSANAKTLKKLSCQPFEQIYNCNFSPVTGALCRLFDSAKITGYRPGKDSAGGLGRSAWCRLVFRLSAMRRANPLNLVDFWGWFTANPLLPEQINPVACPGGQGLGVAIAGREARRSLPLPVLAEAITVAARSLSIKTIKLFGTSTELQAARKLIRMLPGDAAGRVSNLCGKTGWAELISEMTGLDLLLTPDTGLMHLAACLGVPVLAFFLSSAFCHETGPYGKGHLILQAFPDCGPCLESAACQHNMICLSPFQDANFPRVLAKILAGAQDVTLGQGLQLWQTDSDDFGLCLNLLSGEDKAALRRKATRKIIKAFIGYGEAELLDRHLLEELIPAAQWMLPPMRYC